MKDWLNEWYNDQFNQIDLTPSSKVWENIAQSMEEWPKHWYASNAEDVRTKPRPSTWEQLNQQLVRERSIQRANRVPYIAASIIAALLMFVPLHTDDNDILITDPFGNSTVSWNEEYSNLNNNLANNSALTTTRSSLEMDKVFDVERAENKRGSINESYMSVSTIPNKYNQTFINQKNEGNEIQILSGGSDLTLAQKPVRSIAVDPINEGAIVLPVRDDFTRNKLSISVNPQISMLNNPIAHNTITSDNENLSIRPTIAFGLAYQCNFNKRSGLKIAMLTNNNKSLKSVSNKTEREISLNYSSLAALYTTQWDFLRSDRLSFQTEAGLIAGYASDPEVSFNQERMEYLESGFSRFDLGVIVGASLETKLTSKWSLTTGIQSQVGMLNIFKGNEFVPRDYFSTSTQSAGLSFGLIYNL